MRKPQSQARTLNEISELERLQTLLSMTLQAEPKFQGDLGKYLRRQARHQKLTGYEFQLRLTH